MLLKYSNILAFIYNDTSIRMPQLGRNLQTYRCDKGKLYIYTYYTLEKYKYVKKSPEI